MSTKLQNLDQLEEAMIAAGLDPGQFTELLDRSRRYLHRYAELETSLLGKVEFPEDAKLEKGSKFQAKIPGSELQITLEILDELKDGTVEVRMIHPYAGKIITCEITVVGVRAATPRELGTGIVEAVSATGPGATPPPPPGSRESIPELDLEPDEDDE